MSVLNFQMECLQSQNGDKYKQIFIGNRLNKKYICIKVLRFTYILFIYVHMSGKKLCVHVSGSVVHLSYVILNRKKKKHILMKLL